MDSVDLVALDFLVGAIADVGVVGGARFTARDDGTPRFAGWAVQFMRLRLGLRPNLHCGGPADDMGVS